jgi:hypothetical protein
VGIVRSEKARGLFEELELEPAGTMESVQAGRIVEQALAIAKHPGDTLARLTAARDRLAARAARNLRLVERYGQARAGRA